MANSKVIVVMPAYNAESTLQKTVADIPFDWVNEIILVDDASLDKTLEKAENLKKTYLKDSKIIFTIEKMSHNTGYGGNQKKCYNLALSHNADIVVMLHPDYQYDPKLVKYFVEFIRDGYFDVMLGSRIRTRKEALDGGMPIYKYYANRFLTFIQNIVSGQSLSEWHTGMRAYSREVLESLNYEKFSDDFVFDTQVLFSIVRLGYTIGDIPVPVRIKY
jgi:glycosyltransferase involved in cell wall biosynthesis